MEECDPLNGTVPAVAPAMNKRFLVRLLAPSLLLVLPRAAWAEPGTPGPQISPTTDVPAAQAAAVVPAPGTTAEPDSYQRGWRAGFDEGRATASRTPSPLAVGDNDSYHRGWSAGQEHGLATAPVFVSTDIESTAELTDTHSGWTALGALGGPPGLAIAHWAHGEKGQAAVSLGVGTGAIIAGYMIGHGSCESNSSQWRDDEYDNQSFNFSGGPFCKVDGMIFATLAYVLWSAVDVAFFSTHSVDAPNVARAESTPKTAARSREALSLADMTPTVTTRDGGVVVGLRTIF